MPVASLLTRLILPPPSLPLSLVRQWDSLIQGYGLIELKQLHFFVALDLLWRAQGSFTKWRNLGGDVLWQKYVRLRRALLEATEQAVSPQAAYKPPSPPDGPVKGPIKLPEPIAAAATAGGAGGGAGAATSTSTSSGVGFAAPAPASTAAPAASGLRFGGASTGVRGGLKKPRRRGGLKKPSFAPPPASATATDTDTAAATAQVGAASTAAPAEQPPAKPKSKPRVRVAFGISEPEVHLYTPEETARVAWQRSAWYGVKDAPPGADNGFDNSSEEETGAKDKKARKAKAKPADKVRVAARLAAKRQGGEGKLVPLKPSMSWPHFLKAVAAKVGVRPKKVKQLVVAPSLRHLTAEAFDVASLKSGDIVDVWLKAPSYTPQELAAAAKVLAQQQQEEAEEGDAAKGSGTSGEASAAGGGATEAGSGAGGGAGASADSSAADSAESEGAALPTVNVTVMSFGYKFGQPKDTHANYNMRSVSVVWWFARWAVVTCHHDNITPHLALDTAAQSTTSDTQGRHHWRACQAADRALCSARCH